MLIRFVVENLYSFRQEMEFSMIPNGRLKTLSDHKYSFQDFGILKLASIYGANGAGKSNLVKSLQLLQGLVNGSASISKFNGTQFRLAQHVLPRQSISVEFVHEGSPFYYSVVVENGIVSSEELYLSGLGAREDQLLFERSTSSDGITSLLLMDEFEKDERSQILKSILLEEFVKADRLVLKLLAKRDNKSLELIGKAFRWFSEGLQIIIPSSKPLALANMIDLDPEFKHYAEELMKAFNLGINALSTEKKLIRDYFGADNDLEHLIREIEESPTNLVQIETERGDELVIVKEDGQTYVKSLKLEHLSDSGENPIFDVNQESDGTIRLLDFVPAFRDIVLTPKTYIIDEIERSIHPLLIKEMIRKFSHDPETQGQLIFTTHESTLLDQELFRQDEIWFAEKDRAGSTDLYSLSDFKEHKTIDIRKGYLNGKYGSIPFLGNLKDLSWH